MDTLLEVLKWIGVALGAGFIGYFGRYVAMLIIEKIHKRKAEATQVTQVIKERVTSEVAESEQKLKLDKKRAKAEVKKLKKAEKGK